MRIVGSWAGALVVLLAAALPGQAKDFPSWLQELRKDALGQGIRAATLDAALANLAPIERVLELDRRQPEFTMTFPEYLDRVVSNARVQRARERLEQHRALLEEVAGRYGVQQRYIVALWGVESDFGRNMGNFSVVAALATLAYDGRRSAYFRRELMDALKILDQGHVTPAAMTGSWAGAMGQSQFMPSSFLRFAVDHDGDGRRDIWSTESDIFASIANYLARSGWRADETWGRMVQLPSGLDMSQVGLTVQKPLSSWRTLGVRRSDGRDLPPREVSGSVIIMDNGQGPAFLVYENFRTLLKWNRSNFFAAAVGILSDSIE